MRFIITLYLNYLWFCLHSTHIVNVTLNFYIFFLPLKCYYNTHYRCIDALDVNVPLNTFANGQIINNVSETRFFATLFLIEMIKFPLSKYHKLVLSHLEWPHLVSNNNMPFYQASAQQISRASDMNVSWLSMRKFLGNRPVKFAPAKPRETSLLWPTVGCMAILQRPSAKLVSPGLSI